MTSCQTPLMSEYTFCGHQLKTVAPEVSHGFAFQLIVIILMQTLMSTYIKTIRENKSII